MIAKTMVVCAWSVKSDPMSRFAHEQRSGVARAEGEGENRALLFENRKFRFFNVTRIQFFFPEVRLSRCGLQRFFSFFHTLGIY